MICCDNCAFSFTSDDFIDCLFCGCYESPYFDDILSPYDCCYMHTKDFINDYKQEEKVIT